MPTIPEVLFVCVHNAGRSQMAAALLDHHAGGGVRVRSAGSAPTGSINPAVHAVMTEIGIDLSRAIPKKLTTDAVEAADVVITMGCGDACPIFPGKRYLDWDLTDPAGKTPEQIRPIRDDIEARVTNLLTELLPATTTGAAVTEPSADDAVTCACCGQAREPDDVARLGRHPEVALCGGCAHEIAGRLAARPAITPIFPVHDMAAAQDFWTRAGLEVEEYSPEYAFVLFGGAEIAHLDLRADLDPECNAAACYVHVADPTVWHGRWKEQGLPVSDVVVEPWGMVEFSVRDPSGNLIRMGRNA